LLPRKVLALKRGWAPSFDLTKEIIEHPERFPKRAKSIIR